MSDLVQSDSVRQVDEGRGVVVHVRDDQPHSPLDLQNQRK